MSRAQRGHPKSGADQGWQSISQWYDQCVGKEGHFFHRELILPYLEKSLNLKELTSVLDLGCGQGVLEKLLHPKCRYLGVDAAQSLLDKARQSATSKQHQFLCADLSQQQAFGQSFQLAIFLLSLQNIPQAHQAITTAASHLLPDGKLALVLNHPCFRIPRHTEWIENSKRGTLARQIHSYMSPLQIPIQTHPGKQENQQSVSYHHSLTDLFSWINAQGLKVEKLQELISPKASQGAKAAIENRARSEFPLFLYLVASR